MKIIKVKCMAYVESNSWLTPKRDTMIFRYCEEFKFKDLINTKTLYFNELLNYRKNDKRKGLIPKANKEGLLQLINTIIMKLQMLLVRLEKLLIFLR